MKKYKVLFADLDGTLIDTVSGDTYPKVISWNFYQLRSFLEYKCKMNGVQITVIPPAYTSQTCHECGHIGIRNGKHFRCVHCGNVADADVNAALNIATWGYVNTHERWELLSCPIHDDYSTSKAHKSLVCG